MPNIQFVDENDKVIGSGTKDEALEQGIAHRVSRVFLFNAEDELLIQRRGDHLISFPGRWDHSASGHVDEGETYMEAAVREMQEEIGVTGVPLEEISKEYFEEDINGRIAKRFNAVYTGQYDGDVHANPDEVAEVRWISPATLKKWVDEKPDEFTPGFKHVLKSTHLI